MRLYLYFYIFYYISIQFFAGLTILFQFCLISFQFDHYESVRIIETLAGDSFCAESMCCEQPLFFWIYNISSYLAVDADHIRLSWSLHWCSLY